MRSFTTANERLEDLRKEKGLKQSELAEKTGIPSSTLSDYEQEGALIPHTVVDQLADYYEVSADYLIGRTDIRQPEGKELADTHLTDRAINVLKREDINSRLIAEIMEHPDFGRFMMDAEIMIDGYASDSLAQLNAMTEFQIKEASRHNNYVGEYQKRTYEHIWATQKEYFANVLVRDLIPILEDIKKKHLGDPETSDGKVLTAEDMENMKEAVSSQKTRKSRLHQLASSMAALIRVKTQTENTAKAEKVLSSGGQDTEIMTDLLLKSELVEPDARKRRRK
jgi:transcriptional regulator with XRE-family HTH domain